MDAGAFLQTLIFLAGVGQILLAGASLIIPRVLGWRAELAQVRPLTRQVFWTYAAYILGANLAMGLLSALAPHSLLDSSTLAGAVTAYGTLYWGARVLIQLFYFDRSSAPQGARYLLGEFALLGLFFYLTLVYGAATVTNLRAGGG